MSSLSSEAYKAPELRSHQADDRGVVGMRGNGVADTIEPVHSRFCR